jgi:hypothetical protein
MEVEKFVCKTCGVVKTSFTALHNHLRRSHRVKKPDAAVVSSSTLNESDIMLVPMVTTQVASCKEPVQPPPTLLSSVPTATTSTCFESVTNEKLATRQIISRTFKTLASWQQVDRRTLELSTSVLEERLYRELNLTELPPSALTAIVMTARYFALVQHSRVKPRSAEIQSIESRRTWADLVVAISTTISSSISRRDVIYRSFRSRLLESDIAQTLQSLELIFVRDDCLRLDFFSKGEVNDILYNLLTN